VAFAPRGNLGCSEAGDGRAQVGASQGLPVRLWLSSSESFRRYRTNCRASRQTISDRLTTVDAHAAKLVGILSEAQTDDFGIVHIE